MKLLSSKPVIAAVLVVGLGGLATPRNAYRKWYRRIRVW